MDERTKNVLANMENLLLLTNVTTKSLEALQGDGPLSPDLAETAQRLLEGLKSLRAQLDLLSTNR